MIDGHCTRNNRTGANSLEYPESDHVLHKNHASTEARKISQPIDSLMEKFIHSLVTAQGANRPFRCACGLDGLRGAPPRRGKANRADLKNHCDASQRAIQISNEETGFRGDDRCRIASRSGSAPGKISQPVAEGQQPGPLNATAGWCPASITLKVFRPSRPLTAGRPGSHPR